MSTPSTLPSSRPTPVLRRWWGSLWRRRAGLLLLTPVLVAGTWVQATNMYNSPHQADDEGTYVAEAWAVLHWHTLAPYTYWYDHPPLGWILMAGFFAVSGGVRHYPSAIDAGRMFMLVLQEISAVLVYILARRMRLARWTSALAVLAFFLSPVAIEFHRMAYLDNIGTPFVIGAFVLALSPRRHLGAQATSGMLFAMGVLCKETYLLLLPALAWQIWRNSDARTRAFVMCTSATAFVLTVGMYPLYAALRGELFPGPGHVSLLGSIEWQVSGRQGSGTILDSASAAGQTLHQWLGFDPWLMGAGLVMLPICLARRSTRAISGALAIELLTLLRPGYLPIPFVIGILPFAAVVGAGGLDALWNWRPALAEDWGPSWRGRLSKPAWRLGSAQGSAGYVGLRLVGPVLALMCLVGTVVGAAPAWARGDDALMRHGPEDNYLDATHWIEAHVSKHDRILVDDSFWLDLVDAGYPANQVVWFYKIGTDPEVDKRFPQGWRDFQYIVADDTIRSYAPGRPWLTQALDHGRPVASWGSGVYQVTILQYPTVDYARSTTRSTTRSP